jgi:hypothetical protein
VVRLLLSWRTWVYLTCAIVMALTVAGPLEMRAHTSLYVAAVTEGARVEAQVVGVGVDPATVPLASTRSFHEVAWLDGDVPRSAKLSGVPPRAEETVEIMVSPDGRQATSSLARSAANMQALPATMLFLGALLLTANLALLDAVRAFRRRHDSDVQPPVELRRLRSHQVAA